MRKEKSFIVITISKQLKCVGAAVKVWGEGSGWQQVVSQEKEAIGYLANW